MYRAEDSRTWILYKKKPTTLITPKNYEMPLQQATMKRGVIDIDICVGFIIFYLPDDRKCYVYD